MLKNKQNYDSRTNTKRSQKYSGIKNSRNSNIPSLVGRKSMSVKSMYKFQQKRQDLNYNRKQSYLNSCFNKRKNNLLQITKQNKRIYDRINSQKSDYNKNKLNKSYDSASSLSRRNSRMSNGSKSSRDLSRIQTPRSKNKKFINATKHKPKHIQIQSKNIKNMSLQQVMNFQNLFNLKTHQNTLQIYNHDKNIKCQQKYRKSSQNIKNPIYELQPIHQSKLQVIKSNNTQNLSKFRSKKQLSLMDKNLITIRQRKLRI